MGKYHTMKVLPKRNIISVTNQKAKVSGTQMRWAKAITKGSKKLVGGFK